MTGCFHPTQGQSLFFVCVTCIGHAQPRLSKPCRSPAATDHALHQHSKESVCVSPCNLSGAQCRAVRRAYLESIGEGPLSILELLGAEAQAGVLRAEVGCARSAVAGMAASDK